MRPALLIACISLIAAGCKDRTGIPKNILPQKKMKEVLWDMTRADQFIADYWLRKDSSLDRKTESIKLYQQIFHIHHISKKEFQQSFSFYRAHPSLFKAVLDSLNTHANDAPTLMVKPKLLTDSLTPNIHSPLPGLDSMPVKKTRRAMLNQKGTAVFINSTFLILLLNNLLDQINHHTA